MSALHSSMESPLSFFRTHWDHEPTPNPSQEGNRQAADKHLLPSWEGSGVGRFMERMERLDFFIIVTRIFTVSLFPSDTDPEQAQRNAGECPSQLVCHRAGIRIGTQRTVQETACYQRVQQRK